MTFWPHDWGAIFVPTAPVAELIVRGTVIYLFLFAVMRVFGRRLLGNFNMTDILVTLLIAVSVRNGITGGYHNVGDAGISAAVILFWDLLFDRLAYRWEGIRSLLRPAPLRIIHEGHLVERHARYHVLTRTDIMEKLRQKGITSYEEVKAAYLEPDGTLTVVPREDR